MFHVDLARIPLLPAVVVGIRFKMYIYVCIDNCSGTFVALASLL